MNATAAANVSVEDICDLTWMSTTGARVTRTIVLSVIMLGTLLGNVLVVVIFYKFASVRSNTNFFVLNMAVSDLLFPIILWPTEMVDTWTGFHRRWFLHGPVGDFTCKLTAFLTDASSAVSIMSLILITVDRFMAVVYPMRIATMTPRTRTRLIAATWVIAVLITSPYFYIFRLVRSDNKSYCEPSWQPAFNSETASRVYFPLLCVVLFVVPVIVVASLYTRIALALRRATIPGTPNSHESKRQRQSQNILKMSIAVVLVFVLCWLPQRAYVFLRLSYHFCDLVRYNLIVLHLAYSSSALNPWILFYFSEKYRHGLRIVFPGACAKKWPRRGNSAALATTQTSFELRSKRSKKSSSCKSEIRPTESPWDNTKHTEAAFLLSSMRKSDKKRSREEMC